MRQDHTPWLADPNGHEPAADRWVTAAAIAEQFGISLRRAYAIMGEVGYKTTRRRRLYLRPARISRLSDVLAWAAAHPAELQAWCAASSRAKEAYRKRRAERWRTKALLLAALPDPVPEVCFWVGLLLLRRGYAALKKAAFQALLAARQPDLFADVEDRGTRYLCSACWDRIMAAGDNPVDYVAKYGYCPDCGWVRGYFVVYSFLGIDRYAWWLRRDVAGEWLEGFDPPRVILAEDDDVRLDDLMLDVLGKSSRRDLISAREAYSSEEVCAGLSRALERLRCRPGTKAGP